MRSPKHVLIPRNSYRRHSHVGSHSVSRHDISGGGGNEREIKTESYEGKQGDGRAGDGGICMRCGGRGESWAGFSEWQCP